MSKIQLCHIHKWFEGQNCPICGKEGKHVVSSENRRTLSKFLSGVLRHFPDEYNVTLDSTEAVARSPLPQGTSKASE